MGVLEFPLKAVEDALKYEHVSAGKGAPDGSSEGLPSFEVEIKGELRLQLSCT